MLRSTPFSTHTLSSCSTFLSISTSPRKRWFSLGYYHHHHQQQQQQQQQQLGADPVVDMEALQQSILDLAPIMAQALATEGYYTVTGGAILPMEIIARLRTQAVELRRRGRYEPSWSERIVGGIFKERFDKEGVFACEPDGQDYDVAPDVIVYMSVVLKTLPVALNQAFFARTTTATTATTTAAVPHPELSNASFNAKLAVTLPGGSTYPIHIDNPQGLEANDTRKLTCILYLNPEYQAERGDGGELRLLLRTNNEEKEPSGSSSSSSSSSSSEEEDGGRWHVDLTPEGGRLVLFWSDEIPHEVLPTAPKFVGGTPVLDDDHAITIVDNPLDRYALTLWIPTDDVSTIHSDSSPFRSLRDLAFPE